MLAVTTFNTVEEIRALNAVRTVFLAKNPAKATNPYPITESWNGTTIYPVPLGCNTPCRRPNKILAIAPQIPPCLNDTKIKGIMAKSMTTFPPIAGI